MANSATTCACTPSSPRCLPFEDTDLEKLYGFARFLRRLLPGAREELPAEIRQNIDMESFRIQRTSSGQIGLERQIRPLEPAGSKARSVATGQELEVLSRIIEGLNERFGLNLGNEHRLTLEQLRSALDQDPGLDASARVNTRENVRLTFDPKVEDRIQEIVETNFDLYKRITDDPDFGRAIKDLLFDDYIQRHRRVEDLLKLQESKTLEFKSSLRWSLEGRPQGRQARDPRGAQDHRRVPEYRGRRPPDWRGRRSERSSASSTTAWRTTTSSCGTWRRWCATASATGPTPTSIPGCRSWQGEDRLPRELSAEPRADVPAVEGC